MIQENFHASERKRKKGERSWIQSGAVQDSSSLTKQFSCLKSKRINQALGTTRSTKHGDRKNMKGALFPSSREEKNAQFTPFSLIWIILPIMNLCFEIAMDVIGVIMFFVKEIFMSTYKTITTPIFNIFGNIQGSPGKKHCFHYSWIRYLVLVLCPPAAIFMANGLLGWYQIIVCCLATLFYYFPGLAYAIIVIGRSEVNTYMKNIIEGDGCNTADSFIKGFYISNEDNAPKCTGTRGQTCTAEGVETSPGNLDCCAQPYLENGEWKRNGDLALNADDQPIKSYEDGEMVCRNDTEVVTMPKGICVFKSTMKP